MSEEPPDQPATPATPPEPTPPASPADPTTVNPAPPAQPGLISAAPVGWGAPTPPPAGPIGWVDPAAPPAAAPPPGSPGATVGWEPVAPQREVAPGLSYADTISRLIAYVIDLILVGSSPGSSPRSSGPGRATRRPSSGGSRADTDFPVPAYTIPVVILSLAYFVFFWSGGRRATIGQRIFGIQVGNAFDGHPLSIEQALRRWVGLGLFLSLFDLVLPAVLVAGPGPARLVDRAVRLDRAQPDEAGPARQVRELRARPAVRVGVARAGARLRRHRRLVPAVRDPGRRRADPARLAGQRHPVADRRLHLGGARVGTLGRVTETRPDDPQPLPTGDMTPAEFRAAAHAVVDVMADYLETIETRAVFPAIEPGSLRPLFPAAAPEGPEPIDAILADYQRLIEPNATHWQHPGFLAYFATTASGPGILGEMLTAALGQNAMLWRTSPIGDRARRCRRRLAAPGASGCPPPSTAC